MRVGRAFALVIFLVFGVPIGLCDAFAPFLGEQDLELGRSAHELAERLDSWLTWAEDEAEEVTGTSLTEGDGGSPEESVTTRVVQQLNKSPSTQIVGWVVGFVGGIGTAIGGVLLVVFVGCFLAASPEPYVNGTLALVPPRHRPRIREVMDEITQRLRDWVKGQLVAMTIVGVLTTLALWVIGLPMAIVLGVAAGLLDFIPNFGPLIAAVPAVLLAAGHGKIAPVVGVYLVVQFVEGWILRPYIERKAVDTPPALLLAVQVLLASVAGMLGLLAAPALIVVADVVIRRLYVEDLLGDRESAQPG
jgi:predicted PurR-regulated permease PerM